MQVKITPHTPLLFQKKDYPEDLKVKVQDNVKNNRHPLDTAGQKGAISVFIGNLPFSVRFSCVGLRGWWEQEPPSFLSFLLYAFLHVCFRPRHSDHPTSRPTR